MDGYNVGLDKFLLVIWAFLNMCPEASAINPFLEAKRMHWKGEKQPEAMDMPPGETWLTGKTSGPKEEKDPVKRQLSSKIFTKTPSLLLQKGNEPVLYFFCLGFQRRPTQDSTIKLGEPADLLLQ